MARTHLALVAILTLPFGALAQDGGGEGVDPDQALEEIGEIQAQLQAYQDALPDSASSDNSSCISGNKALVDELATTATQAAGAYAEAKASGDDAGAQREARAMQQALAAAQELGGAASVCAQSAGVGGASAKLSVKGQTGGDDDTEKPKVDALMLGIDPPDVSPF